LQSEIYKLQQGAGQPHVYARDIEKFTIPVPPIKKQQDILKHIKDIQQQITKLKADATSILESAKAEVEKMILG
jgi:type I restriction enzyme, S subunit